MINNWHVPRNKRKLYPVVDILSAFALQNLGDVWSSDINRQLDFEAILEEKGLKRPGPRRDRRGGGARTYESWLYALGLIFIDTESKQTRLTLVGEELINGSPPVPLMTNQLMKFQYPSPYSKRPRVRIHERFKIRPFRFLLRLLTDERLSEPSNRNFFGTSAIAIKKEGQKTTRKINANPYLNKREIGVIVSVEAENESEECYEYIVKRILEFRKYGYDILPPDFEKAFPSSTTGHRTKEKTIDALESNANVLINFLEYTQLIVRLTSSSPIFIPQDMIEVVKQIINDGSDLRKLDTRREFWQENFQRSFGLPPGMNRDNRTFREESVSENKVIERIIKNEFLALAREEPIDKVTADLIQHLGLKTGIPKQIISSTLNKFNVDTFGIFETKFIDMAFSGRELAEEFELATLEVFKKLGFNVRHIGNLGRNPDIWIESQDGFTGIIDNKAYRKFSIGHEHELKMINTYIPKYKESDEAFSFYMYISGGFSKNINRQLRNIYEQTGIAGCCITVYDLMRLLRLHQKKPISHAKLIEIFQSNLLLDTRHLANM
ncbi:restriction endonuclease FokI C-terminal domain-containing protein [Halobacillus sp. A5]|uniref:restriction endonuclease FokI C-terminal domain-containing protein n=1 Tax=Halobacillus sp. A5 TaxID=2880263 RepID=UPI0020A632A2|nr:restriction endonuclease FokI C-terminal domain-containing protein [Halobacillus sp. A5]MCP3027021.1 hypothetical protein [Halobacillus sp. A5]